MKSSQKTNPKKIAGEFAAKLVNDGMVIGLGTGSTIAYTIIEIGKMVESGLEILGVPTSYQSAMLASENKIPLTTLDEHPVLDIAIDGADQVCGFVAIKGRGAAHTREKIVANSSKEFVVVVDDSKISESLNHIIPLEVIPFARKLVEKNIKELGGVPNIRLGINKDGPIISDNGNFIIDVDFGEIKNPESLSKKLSECVGVIEHGIFTKIDKVYIGKKDGVEIRDKYSL